MRRRARAPHARGNRCRPLPLQTLEHRCMLAVYWVAPSGNDGQAGTQAAPWASLQHAADEVAAGDTVHVLAGTYRGFDLRTSGTQQNPIRFLAEPGAVINQDNQVTIDGINLEGADWIVIDGFEVTGTTRAGIRSVVNEHVTISNNYAHDNGRWGIFTGFSDDLLIEGNVTTNSVIEHGIYVSNSPDRPVIRNNVIFGNYANGIHLNGDASLGGDGIVFQALVEGNIIYNNGVGGGSGINGDGLVDSVVRNNLIYNTHASGISLYQIDGGQPATGNLVVGNTVVVASNGRWALNIRDGSTGNTILNNVFYSHHSFRGSMTISADSLPGTVSDYNAVESRFTTDDGDSVLDLAAWRNATGLDQHSFAATPAELFVDPTGDDYHLASGSPAIGGGTAVADWITDLAGQPRPMGSGYDIGAYEFLESSSSASVIGRHLFYNDSLFDGHDPAANAADDNAIASDKSPLLAGNAATFANYSSYVQGINGVAIDIAGLPADVTLDPASDFAFAIGNDSNPANWTTPTLLPTVTIRREAGAMGSDRIMLTWPAGGVRNSWLEIRLKATNNTGLNADDVFYFGNAPAETGDSSSDALVDAVDFQGVRIHQTTFLDTASIDNRYDFNRDGRVNAFDLAIVRDAAMPLSGSLQLISIPAMMLAKRSIAPWSTELGEAPRVASLDSMQEQTITSVDEDFHIDPQAVDLLLAAMAADEQRTASRGSTAVGRPPDELEWEPINAEDAQFGLSQQDVHCVFGQCYLQRIGGFGDFNLFDGDSVGIEQCGCP